MRNHFLALLLTLMMICSLVTASALADYSAEAIYTERDGYLRIMNNSVFSKVDHLYYLLNEEGDVISSEDGYTDVESASFFRSNSTSYSEEVYIGFIVTDHDGKKGLLLPDGTMAVPCMYDDVMVRSERWQIGVTLHPSAEGEEKDYGSIFGGGNKSWTITQADVYYCGSLCFTVDGKDFSGGYSHNNEAYGDYICITDRSGKHIWYGRDGKKTNGNDSTYFEYEEGKHAATGTKAFSKKCTLTDEEVYACYYYDENNGDIVTLNGKTLVTVSKADRSKYSNSVSPFRGDYFLLSGRSNGSYVVGLFDLSGKLVIGDLPSSSVCWTDEWLSVENKTDRDNARIGFARMVPGSDIQYYTIGKAYSNIYGSWASYHEEDSDKYYVITASAGKLPLEFKYIHGHAGTEVFTAVPYDSSSYRENLYDLNGNVILEDANYLSNDGTLAVSENRLYRISK